ncbi:hypothetical protein K3495_g436 [Podosphaera aphanis]|nr:hypothetical protein K3495_g436 [Podosphaera aphanis]
MIGESIFFAIEKDVVGYASTVTSENSTEKLPKSTLGYAAMKSELDKIIPPDLDEFKKQKWESANAKILFMLSKCIDQLDREHVEPFDTAKEQWSSLQQKYNKVSAVTKRDDPKQITNFKFGFIDDLPVQMTISSAWSHIVSARSRVNESNPQMAATFIREVLFEYLTSGLPSSFDTVLQFLDANPSQDICEKLDILERNEKRFDL